VLFHFNSKDESNLEFSIGEKCMGCLCKTLPVTVRVFTIVAVFLIIYLFCVAWLPRCERDLEAGFIIKQPCFEYMAELDIYLGNGWIAFRKFLEEYEDDCRGSYGSYDMEGPGGRYRAGKRGADSLRTQSGVSMILISSQLLLGFVCAASMRPPAWLWDPVPKNEGLLKKFLRQMGP